MQILPAGAEEAPVVEVALYFAKFKRCGFGVSDLYGRPWH
jgi:hypothetical protein